MAAIDELIKQIDNPELRNRIQDEVNRITKHKKFGLVFEEHLPECTPLYDMPIKVGSRVAKKNGKISETYSVITISDDNAECKKIETGEKCIFLLNELVCVAEFGESIYPYLKPIDSVCNAPESSLWHTLIEADNYHALQLLEYLYAGKVDCIYIDPPYNTGARDWKYNNDYVDSTDSYRHSKWLSFLERRLKIAKRLLNPESSVLIITIDEKEYLHLGCLLEEMFSEANIQMISSVINPGGTGRANEFTRVNEYIFFVMIGNYTITSIDVDNFDNKTKAWDVFRRHNASNIRSKTSTQFYPLYINPDTLHIEKIGEPIPKDVKIEDVPEIEGLVTTFPIRDDGTEMMWGLTPDEARRRNEKGYIKVNSYTPNRPQKFAIQHLMSGAMKDIENGVAVVTGIDKDGSVIIDYPEGKTIYMKNQWAYPTHNARSGGTELIKRMMGNRFSYPKSLYAVADCIKLFTADKKDALIIDFFAGSGTTLHAVNLLNYEDDGYRRCILVTNNEISEVEKKEFEKRKICPGDEEWESRGIARYVTWPRTVCSIKGIDVCGNRLKGDYITSMGKKVNMSEGFKANANYFKLGFLDRNFIALDQQFKELLPVLWMKAGTCGKCPRIEDNETMYILPENRMAILKDEMAFDEFEEKVIDDKRIQTIFIVTDSNAGYREMISSFADRDTYQLYRDYLDNFRINTGR